MFLLNVVRWPTLDHLTIILHLCSQYRTENHLNIFQKRIVSIVIKIYAYLIGINYLIVIFNWVINSLKNFFFISIFETCRSRYTRSQFKNLPVFS